MQVSLQMQRLFFFSPILGITDDGMVCDQGWGLALVSHKQLPMEGSTQTLGVLVCHPARAGGSSRWWDSCVLSPRRMPLGQVTPSPAVLGNAEHVRRGKNPEEVRESSPATDKEAARQFFFPQVVFEARPSCFTSVGAGQPAMRHDASGPTCYLSGVSPWRQGRGLATLAPWPGFLPPQPPAGPRGALKGATPL